MDKLSSWKMTRVMTGQWPENDGKFHHNNLDSGDMVVWSCPVRVWSDNVGHHKDLLEYHPSNHLLAFLEVCFGSLSC